MPHSYDPILPPFYVFRSCMKNAQAFLGMAVMYAVPAHAGHCEGILHEFPSFLVVEVGA